MGRNKQPIELLEYKQKSHLTKSEIAKRKSEQVKALDNNIRPPNYLNTKQKNEFWIVANELSEIGIMSNLDCDTLGRYIVASSDYVVYTKQISKLQKEIGKNNSVIEEIATLDTLRSKAFQHAQTCASSMGMTITSRCKIVIPHNNNIEKPKNKFEEFI